MTAVNAAALGLVMAGRFAVLVSSNEAAGQASLEFAGRDAERVATVLGELGGFAPQDVVLLKDARPAQVRAALDDAEKRAGTSPGSMVLFYYSGHADAEGLLLGAERLTYVEIRDRLQRPAAAIRLAFLDACHSGSAARAKGGVPGSGYALDVVDPARVAGAAIITASTASEQAQESSTIGGSYFTHHLVSALRGAGDLDGNGRVTLDEAYRYSYGRTVAATFASLRGPQHPSYEYRLAGTGDVVLADLWQGASLIRLPPAADAVYAVMDQRRDMVAEARADPRRNIRVAVAPGRYRVVRRSPSRLEAADVAVARGRETDVEASAFRALPPEQALGKGIADLAHAAFVEAALFGLVLADLGAAPELAVSYRRLAGRLAMGVRGAYAQAAVENDGFSYRLRRASLDLQAARRVLLGRVELQAGGSLGGAYLREEPIAGGALQGLVATARLTLSLDIPAGRHLAARVAWDGGGALLRLNGRLVLRPEVRGILGIGVRF